MFLEAALEYIGETFTAVNEVFRNSSKRVESWVVVDTFFGFEPHSRLTEDAIAKMLEEAVQTSYSKAGEECSILSRVSKQTVKNHIHSLEFPEPGEMEEPKEKREVKRLYVEAVSPQNDTPCRRYR